MCSRRARCRKASAPPSIDRADHADLARRIENRTRTVGHDLVLAAKLVNELAEAADERQLSKTIARYGRVDLLCLDELGYMELDRRGAELLLQVLTEREEKSSVAIASNESFSGWTKTFHRPAALRRHRRPPHLRRQHHRDRHHLLPTRARPNTASRAAHARVTPPTPGTRQDQTRDFLTLRQGPIGACPRGTRSRLHARPLGLPRAPRR